MNCALSVREHPPTSACVFPLFNDSRISLGFSCAMMQVKHICLLDLIAVGGQSATYASIVPALIGNRNAH